jgi:hypothetical protein
LRSRSAMGYDYACFISYKRPPKPVYPPGVVPRKPGKNLWLQLAEEFEEQLDEFLETRIRIFRDNMLEPGSDYRRDISRSLCRSVCMVALVVPQYFESKWCCAEWAAMQSFESTRLGSGKRGLIIPVVCKGDIDKLKRFIDPRLAFDLRGIVSPTRQLSNVANRRKIATIAEKINTLAQRPPPPQPQDCDNFTVTTGPDEVTPRIEEPSPFER